MSRHASFAPRAVGIRPSVMLGVLLLGILTFAATTASAQQPTAAKIATAQPAAAPDQSVEIPAIWWIAPGGAVLALIFAFIFFQQVKRADQGDEKMQEIARYVTEGAYAYLKRQYKAVAIFFLAACIPLAILGYIGVQHWTLFVAFPIGGFFSGLCGFLGMKTATMASNRTAQGAKEGLNRGLTIAFRAGAVMGLVVVGFGLLFITMWFLILTKIAPALIEGFHMSLVEVTVVMLTFGMGASAQALFARVGGGIFTKAADVGADLVGKIEAGIPEDDPRNPATIADNVGDNVGDVAGMGADLYESYCASILAAATLGAAAAISIGAEAAAINLLCAPMVLAGIGMVPSILGIYMVRCKEGASIKQLMGALNLGVFGASFLFIAAAFVVCKLLLGGIEGVSWLGVWGAIVVGVLAGITIGKATEYYTSYDFKPTQEIYQNAETGPATVIIAGIAEGMRSTWMSLATVIVAIMLAFAFAGGFTNMSIGLYGVSIAAVGMLATLGITLATDAYGPIADNAGGNAEMTGQGPEVRKRTDALDSLGNTTAAVGKGFAIGSAALTALALLAAYVEEVRVSQNRQAMNAIVEYVPQAKSEAKAAVGQLFYVGHRKFAMKAQEGTREEHFSAFMALTKVPDSLKPGPVEGPISTGDPFRGGEFQPLGPTDDDNVHVVGIDLPTDIRRHKLRLVSARKASLNQFMIFYNVTLINPKVLCGLFAGVLSVFLFSSMTMKAVGRAAMAMVKEVRRQFRDIPGIMEGRAKPDYARCVAISTAGAQRAMVLPSLLVLVMPVAVGLLLDVSGVLGLLAGALSCGFAMAIFMANAGGAWDNAKKYIETGKLGGKGSDNHKATIVGDTVGDPFKDTSGPSLNILIKLMGMVSVVFAGLIVKYAPQISHLLGLD